MKKTQRTFAEKVAYICKSSAILLMLLFCSELAYSQCPMVCHNINVSLDTIKKGYTIIEPAHVLSNMASCPNGGFKVTLYDTYGNELGNTADCNMAGLSLIVKVTDTISKNSCWAKAKIEDKAGPNITCGKDTISCLALNAYSQGLDQFPAGMATDNCGVSSRPSISIICTERPCSDPSFVAICERKIIAYDQWGLTSQCTDTLYIAKDSISNLVNARDTMIECHIADTIKKDAGGNPIPERVGVPTIKGNPVWPNYSVCKIISRYSDTNYPICGKGRKIRRQWTVVDWCTKKDTTVIQWIKITDTTDPTLLAALPPITASSGAHDCNAWISLPRPRLSDCSGIKSIHYSVLVVNNGIPSVINGSFAGNVERVHLPAGIHDIKYTISDSCSNILELNQVVTVLDEIPPTPVCDENTATTLDPRECWSRVYAADLDNGSHDNCCQTLYFAVIQMDTLTKYQNLIASKIKSKYGLDTYIAQRSKIDLIIDKYINCKYFNDYIDLHECGRDTLVLRVYEACKARLYDPHVHGDSRHLHYCNELYKSELVDIVGLVEKKILGSAAINGNYDFNITVAARNYNDCMVNINVADKQAPVCLVAPEKNAYCDGTPFNKISGATAEQGYYSNPFCVGANARYDTAYLNLDKYDAPGKINPNELFDSAVFTDNCGKVKITSSISGGLNNCGAGKITKSWKGEDACGQLSTTCSQVLTVHHRSDFEVLFPADILTSCLSDLKQFEKPTGDYYVKIFDDECEQVGVSYEDQTFTIAAGACYKILRTWKLIDWCIYNPNEHRRYQDYIVDPALRADLDENSSRNCTFRNLKDDGDGYITYTQVIKVINNVNPTVTKRDSIVACADNPNTCVGRVRLKFAAKDDCTDSTDIKWSILVDLGNNGSIDNNPEAVGPTATIDGDYPVGIHKFTFIARDLCGNETRRESIVDVKLCKKPTPYLLNGLAADLMPRDTNKDGKPESGMLVIWAKDFDAGSYASCGQKIVNFSFSSDTTIKSRTYTCDSVGQRFVNIWVTDSYGNKDWATTYIWIQDNNKACTGGLQALVGNIKGSIVTEDKLDVEKVNVNLDGSPLSLVTKSNGQYAFDNMQLGGSYKVMPKKNINPLNGVSTLDLLLIQKHILGVQSFNSPYKIIAADINKSNDISSVDLVELRKLILGVYDNFQGNESWRFVPSAHKFKNPNNPFDGGFTEYHSLTPFNSNVTADFIGIKIGDVNGTVTPNQLMGGEVRSLDKEVVFNTPEHIFKANELVKVPVYADQLTRINGYQFTISFDTKSLKFMQIEPIAPEMTMSNFGVHQASKGLITTSFASVDGIQSTAKPLFILTMKSIGEGALSESIYFNSKITAAEAYNAGSEVLSVRLNVSNGNSNAITLMQNSPNPFKNQTRIGFVMPKAESANLRIFDINGRVVKSITGDYQKGYNEVIIHKNDLNTSGMYYYQLQSDGFTATKKMILIE